MTDVPLNVPVDHLPLYKAREVGTYGLLQYDGVVSDEYLPELRGDKANKVYRQMGDTPIVGAVLFAVKMLMRKVNWTVEPHEDDSSDEAAKFVKECLHDMDLSWGDTLSQIATMVQFGWSWHEIVYKKRNGFQDSPLIPTSKYTDGKIGWDAFAQRPQDTLKRWELKNGRVLAMVQNGPSYLEEIVIPRQKSLHFRTEADKGNPQGRSMLRSAFEPWYFMREIQRIEAVGIERDLAGLPVIYVPWTLMTGAADATQLEALDQYKELVRGIKRNEQEGVLMPLQFDENNNQLYRLELLSTGGQRQFDTDKIVARYAQQITQTILADFIMLGHEAVGSKALGSSKIDLFTAALETWVDIITDEVNSHAIPRLLTVNGMDTNVSPALTHDPVQDEDITAMASTLLSLAQAGMPLFPSESLENWIRDKIAAPPLDPDEEPISIKGQMLTESDQLSAEQAAEQTRADEADAAPASQSAGKLTDSAPTTQQQAQRNQNTPSNKE